MENENRWAEEIAGRVRGVISDVAESLELGHWNQTVKDTAGSVLEEARKQMEQYRNRAEDTRWRRQAFGGAGQETAPAPKPLEIKVNWKGRVSGVLLTVFGSVGSAAFGISALALLAVMMTSLQNPMGWWITGVCGAAALGFGAMLWTGILQNKRIGRLKRYVEELKRHGKSYCEIEELSRNCVKSPDFVRRDLKKILGLGMLPDARLNRQGSWLLLDNETYRQYQLFEKAQEREKEAQKDQKAKKKGREDERTVSEDRMSPLEAAVRQGEEFLADLAEIRQSMPQDPAAEKLARMENILTHLFEALKKHPEQLDEMEKCMEYYLPTTLKLARSYREFEAVRFPGDNINQAKKEILQSLDTINGAFEKLLDDLYEDAAFDVMTDVSVLQTMLARDGMTEKDFKLNAKAAAKAGRERTEERKSHGT